MLSRRLTYGQPGAPLDGGRRHRRPGVSPAIQARQRQPIERIDGIVALIIPQAVLPQEPSVMDHRSLHAQPLFAIEFTVACGGDLLRRIARERVPDAPHRGRAEPASRRSKTSHRPDASRAVGSGADVIRRASDHRNLRSP
jgi:hypothetical protein